jgi:E3 ubiquitin-protein ligase RNF14
LFVPERYSSFTDYQPSHEEIKAYSSKEVFERYDKFMARQVLNSDPTFWWCRAEGCLSGQIHDVEEVGNVFVCVECHARFCTVHVGAYHDNETCEEYEYRTGGQKKRGERKKEDVASERAVKRITKRCPRETCQVPIQKNK